MYVGTSVFIEHFFLVQTLIQRKEARSLRILASVFFEAWFSCVHFVMFAGYLCNDDSKNNHLYFFFPPGRVECVLCTCEKRDEVGI